MTEAGTAPVTRSGTREAASEPGRGTGRLKADRVSREDWLTKGLQIIGQTGPGGIRIDQVCRAMKVTKGSFYWHFQDRQDLLDKLFLHWRARETTALIDFVETRYDAPADRIRHVVAFVTFGDYDVATEVAMRQWGQADDKVRAGLQEVDAERLDFFTRQFAALGFGPAEARLRAITVYSLTLSCGYMLTGESREELERRMRASMELLLVH